MARRPILAAATLALVSSAAALAAAPGDPVVAVRRGGPVVLDGRVDDPAWAAAPVHDGFFQQFPAEGRPPSERTEVRVLYDDRALYVGVTCLDSRPSEISRPLGRRDRAPASDAVAVLVDSTRGGHSAYVFEVSAAGVQSDGLLSEDDAYSTEWDTVWEGAAAAFPGGWSAELRIPLSALRLSNGRDLSFGFGVRRILTRTHETLLSVPIPQGVKGQVARLGLLTGLTGVERGRALEVAPYVASRLSLHPRSSSGDPARPRILDPVNEVGLDLRAALGGALSLQAAVNPDFGQVEADEVVQNLSTFEIFFPEKRPFFTQGMDLFLPVAPPGRASPQQLFYSRRIGLDAPILAAAKLSGNATDEIQVGLVESFVSGAGLGGVQPDPPRDLRLDASQPLWLGPRSALPSLAPAPRNLAAGVLRWRPTRQASLGASFGSALLAGPPCTAEEAALPDETRPKRCDVLTGNAFALDGSARTRDGEWYALGQVTGSQALGGAPARTLLDGTAVARGDLGFGAHAAAGRQGGEGWRPEIHWEYESPGLDLNAIGYQRTQNEQLLRAFLRYVELHAGAPFQTWTLGLAAEARRTTDGRGLDRGARLVAFSEGQLRSFHSLGCNAALDTVSWDVREVQESGAALHRPGSLAVECWVSTDPSRALAVEGGAGAGRTFQAGPLAPVTYGGVAMKVAARPHVRLETRLDAKLETNRRRARWVTTDAGSHWFADLTAPVASATLRQQLALSPRLTLQAYAQLFASYGRHGAFYAAPAGARLVAFSDLSPRPRPDAATAAGFSVPEFHTAALNVNVVLRWEYRTGSTVFVVYSRNQGEGDYWSGRDDIPFSLAPQALAGGPTTDALLVKWSHYWAG